MTNPELIADYRCLCGENPLWHPHERRVYWLDIFSPRMFRYDPVGDRHEQFYAGRTVGGFTFQRDGKQLLFMDRGAIAVLEGREARIVFDDIAQERESRFNDVFADPVGRVYCGTMPTGSRPGRLYRLDTDGSLTVVIDRLMLPNGMGLAPDGHRFYVTDSLAREILQFDYDPATGRLCNRQVFCRGAEADGLPDGLAVDTDGCVWSARWDGGCLLRYAPDGSELLRIGFPARKVSSLAFGGDDAADIYVTTAGGDAKPSEGDGAGALFRLRVPGVRGLPRNFSDIRV